MRLLRGIAAFFIAVSAMVTVIQVATPAAQAAGDPYQWHPCRADDEPYHRRDVLSNRMYRAPIGPSTPYTNGNGGGPLTVNITNSWEDEVKSTTSLSLGAEVDEIVKATANLTNTTETRIKVSSVTAIGVTVPPGSTVHVQHTIRWNTIFYARWTLTDFTSNTRGGDCRKLAFPHLAIAAANIASGPSYCTWWTTINDCYLVGAAARGGAGAPPGSGSPGGPPGPQPVTSVIGLADGTVLATTDTQRIYKMVGGAPVWQATCDDDICQPQSRPTTQAVINAGPATPRDGSSAIDQRGQTFLFVGGAPVRQDDCGAPVTCGSPVKISSWSIDARDHMNQHPADGSLVQARSGSTDLPVSVVVGGALIPFATPEEVVDSGYGADWRSRVVAISAGSYNAIGFNPADGTLIQGAAGGVSTPVAMVLGGAAVPFESPQEVIDAGYGANWAAKVRGVPARYFNALPPVPQDGTLIQGSLGSTPVAAVIGTSRVNFATPQEVVDAGFGADWAGKVRAVPARAFNLIRTGMIDGTRLKNAATPSQAAVIGGAKVPLASQAELDAIGYADKPMWTVPARVWDALPTRIGDGTRIKNAGSTSQAAIVGGAKVPFASESEVVDAGYDDELMQIVPERVWDGLPTRIADGTRLNKAGFDDQAAVVGTARVPFVSMDELTGAGYGERPMQVVPPRVWDALPAVPQDRTLVQGRADGQSTPVAQSVGGAAMSFGSPQEILDAGFGADWATRVQPVPPRVFALMQRAPADGTTLIGTNGVAYRASGGTLETAGSCPEWSGCAVPGIATVAQDTLADLLEYRPAGRAWVDFTGDGRADYCRRVGTTNQQNSKLSCTPSTGSGFGPAVTSGVQDWGYAAGRQWADFNGDGKADYCRVGGDDNHKNARAFCTLSTGTGFGAQPVSGVLDAGEVASRTWADVSGDGRADFCRVRGTANFTNAVVSCALSTGTGFGADISSANLDWGFAAGRAWTDFNGDGKADYCRVSGDTNHTAAYATCTVSTGSGFGATYRSDTLDWGAGPDRAWADVNGDGRSDYCRRVGSAADSHVSCTLSTGTGFGATIISGALDWGQVGSRTWTDADGDGKADYCRVQGTANHTDARMTCTRSTGTGFGADIGSANTDWGYVSGRFWADVNGDARADFCRRVGDTNQVRSRVSCTTSNGVAFEGGVLSDVLDWGSPN